MLFAMKLERQKGAESPQHVLLTHGLSALHCEHNNKQSPYLEG